MPIDVKAVRAWSFPIATQSYTVRDSILYALALGYGTDPTDPAQLRFVYERGLAAVPAGANVLCHPGFWIRDPRTGIDATQAVHASHHVRHHAPLPPQGTVTATTRVADVIDRGPASGAMVVTRRELHDQATGALLATLEQHTLCRADGGFSGRVLAATPRAPVAPPGEPDRVVEIATLPQAALLYRLSADPNPLHADPEQARAAGFRRPILHGLCTFGVATRVVLQACCGGEPSRLRSIGLRFSAPVFPGDTLRLRLWRRDPGAWAFDAEVVERPGRPAVTGGNAHVSEIS